MKRRANGLLLIAALLIGCDDDAVPRPKGWPRLDLPASSHERWQQDGAPFSTELPAYAQIAERKAEGAARWYDLRFAGQRATVHLTYSAVQANLPELIEDAHEFKRKHEAKAARIRSERMLRDSARVFGTLFDVEGDVASPCVFYLTDSTDHFLYGALYFDAPPNADSLAPVTARLRSDIRHMAATLEWGAR
jgi:gliding motility-associated lipoprotein GldD